MASSGQRITQKKRSRRETIDGDRLCGSERDMEVWWKYNCYNPSSHTFRGLNHSTVLLHNIQDHENTYKSPPTESQLLGNAKSIAKPSLLRFNCVEKAIRQQRSSGKRWKERTRSLDGKIVERRRNGLGNDKMAVIGVLNHGLRVMPTKPPLEMAVK